MAYKMVAVTAAKSALQRVAARAAVMGNLKVALWAMPLVGQWVDRKVLEKVAWRARKTAVPKVGR